MRIALIGAGVGVMGFAVAGALTDPDVKAGVLLFAVVLLIGHDAVFMPMVYLGGALLGRRPLVKAVAVAAVAFLVVAVPILIFHSR